MECQRADPLLAMALWRCNVRIRKGDTVEVISGDDLGARGTIHRMFPREGRVVISGVNLIKRHTRPTGQVKTKAGIIEREAPIDLSKVALVCSSCDRWTRVSYEIMDDGSKVRVCKRCGERME